MQYIAYTMKQQGFANLFLRSQHMFTLNSKICTYSHQQRIGATCMRKHCCHADALEQRAMWAGNFADHVAFMLMCYAAVQDFCRVSADL